MTQYFNGSTSNAAAGQFLVQTIDAKLTTEPGITKVGAGVVSGTLTWNVYKSAAGTNERGVDFYFALGYPTAAPTALCFTVMETFNATNNQATIYPPASASVTPTANFANPGATSNLPSSGANFSYMQTANMTSAFTYGCSVDSNSCKLWVQNSAPAQALGYYWGLVDPFMNATDDPLPLVCVNMGGSAAATSPSSIPTTISGLTTREPRTNSVNATNFAVGTSASTTQSWTLSNGGATDVYIGFPYLSRVLLNGRSTSAYRGLLKDCYYGPAQTQNGDQVTWNVGGVGHTAVRASTSSGGMYFEAK